MRFSTVIAALVSAAVPFVSGAAVATPTTYTILVGMNSTLTYTPSSVNATVGDIINFQFVAGNHTATQSTFADPCANNTTPMTGVDSGFKPVAANATSLPAYSFTMTNSTPLWFYCRQAGHCQKGMVFAVNPTAQSTFAMFQETAMSSNTTTGGMATTSGSVTAPAAAAATTTPANGALALGGSAAGIITTIGLLVGVLM
ncbi:hypothetical protein SERLA73DRAFT_186596 [Serpula lacrymans var. lacrymans S7.3]|uniref:Phytocyanin domain-containing protein n=2 Tax=Serpula lacrymans var. lacrymans TaxID=341189 RepID=F8Q7J7_SERL3|nr:uncharacterized protein SERLADRAFT_475733 [Serpula lacrymans var. lacrymans S7.9]EGN95535.1 hypothetical protein SERLA73DRAFT_186596 [Serpula lacrymans var. lacrymans S7.3]EGO21062.1 hypothetical protein SERLADRAFT_475733 [Serpula lacrymans var. lacrymans S7.9]